MATPQKILLGDTGVKEKSVAAAVSCSKRKIARGALLDIDQEIHGVWLTGFLGRQLNIFEVSCPLQGVLALRDLRAGKKLLLSGQQFSAHNLISRLGISGH